MRDQYITTGDGFILVFSVGAAASAERIPEIYERILLVKNANSWPAVLCANKADLPPSQVCDLVLLYKMHTQGSVKKKREINQGAITALGAQLQLPIFETSAKTRQNVEEVT